MASETVCQRNGDSESKPAFFQAEAGEVYRVHGREPNAINFVSGAARAARLQRGKRSILTGRLALGR